MSSPEPLGTPSTIHASITSPSTSPMTLQSNITNKFLKYRIQLDTFIETDPNNRAKERCRCKSCRNSEIKFQSISSKQSKNNHIQSSEHQLALAFLLIDIDGLTKFGMNPSAAFIFLAPDGRPLERIMSRLNIASPPPA